MLVIERVFNAVLSLFFCFTVYVMDVLIIGHSFIRRLRDWACPLGFSNLRLSDRFRVHWKAVGGVVVARRRGSKSVWQLADSWSGALPPIVFMDVGANNLSDPDLDPSLLVKAVLAFARDILGRGARVVYISQLLSRCGQDVSYNARIYAANVLLQERSAGVDEIVF